MSIAPLPRTHPLHAANFRRDPDPARDIRDAPTFVRALGRSAYHILAFYNTAPGARLGAQERATWRAHGEALAARDPEFRWRWESLPDDPDPTPSPVALPVPVIEMEAAA